MAWTTPRTWVQDELVNASTMNTHVRDNLAALYSMAAWPARNLAYNGAMQVSQRAAVGVAVTGKTAPDYYGVDRWRQNIGAGTWTISQEADYPNGTGLARCMKLACTTAKTPLDPGSFFLLEQPLEGYDVQRIAKGTSNAQPLTLSFWVKSNVTGTYTVELGDSDNNRQISATYTVSASATWEQKTITFPADTTGVFDNDENSSLRLRFWLCAGTTYTSGTLNSSAWGTVVAANRASASQANVASANTNYWQLTGVQLETGSVATPFEFLPFGDDLRRCQRYYLQFNGSTALLIGQANSTSRAYFAVPYAMRVYPTLFNYLNVNINDSSVANPVTAMNATGSGLGSGFGFFADCAATLTQGRSVFLTGSGATSFAAFGAEIA